MTPPRFNERCVRAVRWVRHRRGELLRALTCAIIDSSHSTQRFLVTDDGGASWTPVGDIASRHRTRDVARVHVESPMHRELPQRLERIVVYVTADGARRGHHERFLDGDVGALTSLNCVGSKCEGWRSSERLANRAYR